MREDKLAELSMDFAVVIARLTNRLRANREYIISDQLGRSGMSIGANIREAAYAQSRADFVSKMQIALKEANESGYWLEVLFRTEMISPEIYHKLNQTCKELRLILIATLRTAKANGIRKQNAEAK